MRAYRHRKPKRLAAWLAAFAIMLQALLPGLHHPGGMALAGTLALVDAPHLCLAPGSAPVSPGDRDKAPGHHQPDCPICQAMHAIGGFPPPTALVLAHDAVAAPSIAKIAPSSRILGRSFRPQQPRAPPSLA
jgi:hypothetical protein